MGFGGKLNLAFITVITVMTVVQLVVSLFVDWTSARSQARKSVEQAQHQVKASIDNLWEQESNLAMRLEADQAFRQALSSRNRGDMAAVVRSFLDRRAFPGYVAIILDDGKVFYSSDINKAGYETAKANAPLLANVLGRGTRARIICAPTATSQQGIAAAVPCAAGNKIDAALIVFQPLSDQTLVGFQRQVELGPVPVKDIDLAYLSMSDRRVTAMTPNLTRSHGGFISKLNQEAGKTAFAEEVEYGGRLWRPIAPPLSGPDLREGGRLYVSTVIPDFIPKVGAILVQVGAGAGAALVLSFLFSAGIAGRFDSSMRFLKQRAKDLAGNKQDLRSLAELSGEWVELAEMMDTAVLHPRSSVQSLRQQVALKEEEVQEKQKQIDAINRELESVNRQLSSHNRQAAEVNKQVGSANLQVVQIQQKLSAVLAVSTEGYLMLDPYGSVLSANPMFLNWMGVSEREIAGRSCFDLVKKPDEPRDGRTSVRPQNPADLINYFYPEGIVYHRFNSKQVEVLIHLQPVVMDENTIQGYIMVLRDKSAHSELARLRNEVVSMLKDEIRRRLHESEIDWTLVMGREAQSMNPQVTQSLVKLQKVSQELLGVVDSYLMLYGGFVPVEVIAREPVSISRLIGECLEQVSHLAREHQITLDYKTVTGLPNTATSREIIKDVITQLLEKMISVTAAGGRVRAETAVRGTEIRLIISSSGPALGATEIEEMFVGFIDGKHDELTYQSRLSMYLARSNAERLGGRVWAESESGRGTAIFLTLPVH